MPGAEDFKEYLMEDAIIYTGENYKKCVEIARTLFTEQGPQQSASATIFIGAKEVEKTAEGFVRMLKEKINNLSAEAIPSAVQAYKWHYKDLIAEMGPLGTKLVGQIAYRASLNESPELLDLHVKEYAFHLKAEYLSKAQEEVQPEGDASPSDPNPNPNETKE